MTTGAKDQLKVKLPKQECERLP